MTTTHFVLLAATGMLTIAVVGCEDSNKTAANKPARKVYYAHNVETGSNLPRAYTDPNEASAPGSGTYTGSPDAGQQPFINGGVARGGGGGAR